MTLFACIDKADNALKHLSKKNNFADKAYLFFSFQNQKDYDAKKQSEIIFLKKIRCRLVDEQHLIETDSNRNLSALLDDLIPELNKHLKTASPLFLSDLKFILHELIVIALRQKIENVAPMTQIKLDEIKKIAALYHFNITYYDTEKALRLNKTYQKYQTEKYKIAQINQGREPLGTSGGQCYGFTSAMTIPHLSPYHNIDITPKTRIVINRKIYEYQKNQSNEKADQRFVKKQPLTRRHFCSDKTQQAKEILKYAKAHSAKDLQLILYRFTGAHACYLRVNIKKDKSQEIWYMDPNHGAYRFNTEAEFIEFYALSLKKSGYTRYELSHMQYSPDDTNVPGFSFSKFWYFLLTGPQYLEHATITGKCIHALLIATFVLRDLLLMMGALFIGLTFLPPAYALVPLLITEYISLVAIAHNYRGILGPIQFLKECCHQLDLFIHSLIDEPEKELLGTPAGDRPNLSMV